MLDGNSLVLTVTKTDSDKRFNERDPFPGTAFSSRHVTIQESLSRRQGRKRERESLGTRVPFEHSNSRAQNVNSVIYSVTIRVGKETINRCQYQVLSKLVDQLVVVKQRYY